MPGTTTQDSNGDWVTTQPSWVYKGACREETNGKGHQIEADGAAYVFSATIQMPKGANRIPEGTTVLVLEAKVSNTATLTESYVNEALISGAARIKQTVKKCDVGQLHTRIWV
ncbi:hypothetical protein [Leadbetterella byssophila]|uniref:hypothetical protein n=1 Tax=Leadbetterella byssophila TaxID=316068 RepID=UPI0039A2987E